MIKLEDLKWKYRVKRHKFYKKVVSTIVKHISLSLLKKGRYELKITHNEEGYDSYVYCKHNDKQYCRPKPYWKASITRPEVGYAVFGTSKEQLYLELINLIIFRAIRFPFC